MRNGTTIKLAARGAAGGVLLCAHPQLFVTDVRAACRYYAATLGFNVVFVHGDPPFYGQVGRDGAYLNLRHVCGPVLDGDAREREVLLSAYIEVTRIEGLYEELRAAGADFKQTLQEQPWGTRDFVVRDPDGNLLCFAS